MEAPEKIYVKITHPISNEYTEIVAFEDGDCVEYTRTEAFIDKACEWLKENSGSYWMDDYDLPTDELVKDFKNYMKGE